MEKIVVEKFDSAGFGEEHACRFLKKKGLKILHRNFKAKGGEIDIVARSGQTGDLRGSENQDKYRLREAGRGGRV